MANEFKVKKGLIVTGAGAGTTIFDVQGSQGQLFSVTDSLVGELFSVNDISGIPIMTVSSDEIINMGTYGDEAIRITGNSVSMGDAYIKSIDTQSEIIKPSLNLLGTVTELYQGSLYFPEEKTSYSLNPPEYWTINWDGSVYFIQFPYCNNVGIKMGDTYMTLTTNGGESAILTIDYVNYLAPVQYCEVRVLNDQNFNDFRNSSAYQNYGQGIIYSKVIPAGNRSVNVLKTDKPALSLGSGDTVSVDGKIPRYSAYPDRTSGNNSSFYLTKSASYSHNSFVDFTIEGWFSPYTNEYGTKYFNIVFTYYGTVFSVDSNMSSWTIGQSGGAITGVDFNKPKTHIAFSCTIVGASQIDVVLYIDGVYIANGSWVDNWGIGMPDPFGSPSYNIQPMSTSSEVIQFMFSYGIKYSSNFTPDEILIRDANTIMLFDGVIIPITVNDFILYNTNPLDANAYSNNSILQDSVNGVGLVSMTFNTMMSFPYNKVSAYNKKSLGNVYTGMTNTYLPPSLTTYSIGDVIRYAPQYSNLYFKNIDSTLGKVISYNTIDNTISYEGLVSTLTYDSVNSNYYTLGSTKPTVTDNIIIGKNISTLSVNGVAIGNNANIANNYNVAIGAYAHSNGSGGISVGYNASANGSNSVAVGFGASANYMQSTAIGNGANANGNNSTTIGTSQNNNSYYGGVMIGNNSYSDGSSYNLAIGSEVNVYGGYAIGIGRSAYANGNGSIAIGGYSSRAEAVGSQAFGYYGFSSSPYVYTHKTNTDYQFANQVVRFSYWISNQTFTGKRYISKDNNLNSTLQTNTSYSINGLALMRGAGAVTGNMGVGTATIMIKATGTSLPNDWKIVEIKFLLRSLASNSDYTFTIISTTAVASGSGSNQSLWTPTLEYSSNCLVFAIDKSTNNTPIGAVAHIDFKALNTA